MLKHAHSLHSLKRLILLPTRSPCQLTNDIFLHYGRQASAHAFPELVKQVVYNIVHSQWHIAWCCHLAYGRQYLHIEGKYFTWHKQIMYEYSILSKRSTDLFSILVNNSILDSKSIYGIFYCSKLKIKSQHTQQNYSILLLLTIPKVVSVFWKTVIMDLAAFIASILPVLIIIS